MSLFPSSAIPAGATGFDLEQSLRFNDDDSATLTRTPSSTGSETTWTFSCWVKPSKQNCALFGSSVQGDETYITMSANGLGRLTVWNYLGGGNAQNADLVSTSMYRDYSAWYHICVVWDTTNATSGDRVRMYINGTRITDMSTEDYPSQNATSRINTNVAHTIGNYMYNNSAYLDGYLAEVHFIDGTALTPTSFGETGTYGEWKPIEVSGLTYGTNGFYLDFSGVNNTIIAATGGTIYTDGDYKYHKFTSDGTFTVTSTQGASIVDALVIAGGGGGGGDNGGGGGAGGYLYTAEHSVSATAYSITVGDGGAGAGGSDAVNGQNSVFSSLTATGGGFGGTNNKTHAGASGGSGGGGGGGTTGGGGSGTAGQGYAGGSSGGNTSPKSGGGGGGAGAVGSPGPSTGTGGIGSNAQSAWATITSSGDSGYYAGGAGAGHEGAGADNVGGTGGGGAGGGPSDTGVAGTANTGGGGGGAGSGGAGGSGIVIIRYKFQ